MSGAARRNIVRKSQHCHSTITALRVRQQNRFYVRPRNRNSAVYKSLSDFKL